MQMPGDKAHSMVLVWGLRLREAEQAAEAGTLSREDENFLRLFLRYILALLLEKFSATVVVVQTP